MPSSCSCIPSSLYLWQNPFYLEVSGQLCMCINGVPKYAAIYHKTNPYSSYHSHTSRLMNAFCTEIMIFFVRNGIGMNTFETSCCFKKSYPYMYTQGEFRTACYTKFILNVLVLLDFSDNLVIYTDTLWCGCNII